MDMFQSKMDAIVAVRPTVLGRMLWPVIRLFVASASVLSITPGPAGAQIPGRIANRGFENEPMKSAYFFVGDWRGSGLGAFYDGLTPATNECLYTVHPLNPQHLGWSETLADREFAVNTMLAAGVNVVNMSYWGPPGDNTWAWYAPMQTAIGAHDQLFEVAVGRPLLIIPTIEEADANNPSPQGTVRQTSCPGDTPQYGPVGNSTGYHFRDDFPGTLQDPAPGLVFRIEDLIHRYLKGGHPEWAAKWAQLYDRDGKPRYAVSIIHVGSSRQISDSDFAATFDRVADKVWRDTGGWNGGIRVGFTLDALPGNFDDVVFFPTPGRTGPKFLKHASVLAIQGFIPELWPGICSRTMNPNSNCDQVAGSSALNALIAYKRTYIQGWIDSRVPVILDVAPGYDAQFFRGPDIRYGNNDPWRNAQSGFLSLGVVGLVGNTWNGFTEGYALMPACGTPPGLLCSPFNIFPENVNYNWFRDLIPPGGKPARLPSAITSIRLVSSAFSNCVTLAVKLTEALRDGPSGTTIGGSPIAGRILRFQVGSHAIDAVTDAGGNATATIPLNHHVQTIKAVISFAGDNVYLPLFVKDRVSIPS